MKSIWPGRGGAEKHEIYVALHFNGFLVLFGNMKGTNHGERPHISTTKAITIESLYS